MVFSSTFFVFFFFPFVFILYNIIPSKFWNIFLLCVSLLFYAWGEPFFIFVMVGSILLNYISGLLISKFEGQDFYKKIVFIIGISLNIFLLIYFKYFNFLIENLTDIFKLNINFEKVILPIGISFFTFQALSYIIDLYFNKIKVQKNLIDLALYISLFPQLIAGPIVRYKSIENQLKKRSINIYKTSYGLKRFIAGLTKKVFFANILGETADKIFALNINEYSQLTAWLGILCYTFQIYYDFSGYSDMAIGLGRMFGFRFIENFNYPYISRTITEFWRRWHISLSSWFRDYVYIPLGGNRKGKNRTFINLIIVFLLTGFWHGASWNFIIWGIYYGIFLIFEKIFLKFSNSKKFGFWNVYTFFIIVNGWVLFRSPDLNYAFDFFRKLYFNFNSDLVIYDFESFFNKRVMIFLVGAFIFCTPIIKNLMNRISKFRLTFYVERFVYVILIFLNIIFVGASTYNPFIYFRF
ncbi:MAG: MBOAT family protein [Candidatus Muirbacterium halophilum]|nr:MBOAT family protein [Candidatus Muirbacterium halophilum]MCK9474633.1 MBOAT family protein [Candidatus Muirbacterium halophilum]